MTWLDKLLQHESVAAALITAAGAIVLAIVAWVSGFGRWLGRQLEIGLDRKRKRSDAQPPKKTLLIADDLSIVPPNFWRIDQYDASGSATGFRALLVVTCLIPRVRVTGVTARLPFRFRRCKVLHAMLDPHQQGRGLSVELSGTSEVAVNFYVRPPIDRAKDFVATVCVRDQFLNWHERKITFHNNG